MSSFRQAITVKRQNGSYVNGTWVPATDDDIPILASIQPATSKDIQNLPEGRRTRSTFALFTETELLAAEDGATPKKADRVTIAGDVFEVMRVDRWQNNVINHYRAVVSKIE